MTKIEINNLTTIFFNEETIKKTILNILNSENYTNHSVSVVIVGPETIKKLNKKYRGKNRATNVLSFAIKNNNDNRRDKFIDPTNSLGEIVICPKYIKKILKRGGNFNDNLFVKKFLQTLIHGVLHLLGYDHKKTEESQKMREKEDFFNKLIKIQTD